MKKCLLILSILFFTINGQSQTINISGVVWDSVRFSAVPMALVELFSPDSHLTSTVSNLNGEWEFRDIKFEEGLRLVFTSMGMEVQRRPVVLADTSSLGFDNEELFLPIYMATNSELLDEVLVLYDAPIIDGLCTTRCYASGDEMVTLGCRCGNSDSKEEQDSLKNHFLKAFGKSFKVNKSHNLVIPENQLALVYPNSARSTTTVASRHFKTDITVFDMQGREVLGPIHTDGGQDRLNVEFLSSGLYIVSVAQMGQIENIHLIVD